MFVITENIMKRPVFFPYYQSIINFAFGRGQNLVVANLMGPKFRRGWSIRSFIRSSTWIASVSRWGVLLH